MTAIATKAEQIKTILEKEYLYRGTLYTATEIRSGFPEMCLWGYRIKLDLCTISSSTIIAVPRPTHAWTEQGQ